MPFAPYDLTDAVVRANWLNLRQVAIIGNRLDFVTGQCFGNDPQSQHLKGRAKATEAAQLHATEVMLWDGDLVTWLQETSRTNSEELTNKLNQRGKDGSVEGEDGEDGEPGSSIAGDLNASLVAFRPDRRGWPEAPPPQPRSRL